MNSEAKDLQVFMNYRRLRHTKRCNTIPTLQPIDVSQHSYYVAMLAMAISDEYNTYADNFNLDFHPIDFDNRMELLNTEKVLRKALTHDIEEAFTSDIPWNIKHMDEETHSFFSKVINKRIDAAYEGTSTMKLYQKLGKECKDGLEGEVVNLADMTELAIYCWEEVSVGNTQIKPMLNKCLRLMAEDSIYSVMMKASPLFRSIRKMLNTDPRDTAEDIIDIN